MKMKLWPGWTLWILAVLSGGLLTLVFPKYDVSLLAWIALLPLLVALAMAPSARHSFGLGLLAGAVQFAGMLTWIPFPLIHYGNIAPAPAIAIYGVLAVFLAIFPGLFGVLIFWGYRYGGRWAPVLAPCAWVASELARNHLAVNGFPWCLLGYSQTAHLPLMQIADITGIYGVSFLIALVNAVMAGWIIHGLRVESAGRGLVAISATAFCLFLITLGYGFWPESHACTGKAIPVVCIQGNLPISDTMEPYREKYYQGYPRLIRRALQSDRPEIIYSDVNGPSLPATHSDQPAMRQGLSDRPLVILPESPTPFYFQTDPAFRTHMIELARTNHIWLLFNNTSYERVGAYESYFNSVLLLNPKGDLVSRYDKIHLVPFGEYVPLKSWLRFAGKVLHEVSDFRAGKEVVVSDMDQVKFGTVICFEALFPELVRRFPLAGAEFLVNLTNDAWYGDTAAPYQHYKMVIVRAIENRRYVVRATNSGITSIIDPYGRSLLAGDLFREGILSGRVVARNDLTFYTRFGDVFAWICAIIALVSPIIGYFKGVESKDD
ncbi:MAG: apolipoprotein N-acyltransferase [Acidobacteria bacterium]|nr:apolipoprotein N-acyltransferase [Acidobacteriota bacterium]